MKHLPVVIVLGLLAAACAAGPSEAERVAARQAFERSLGPPGTGVSAEAPPESTTVPPTSTAAAPEPVDVDADALVSAIADDGLRFQMSVTIDQADAAASQCGDAAAWTTAIDAAAVAAATTARTVRDAGADLVGTPEAEQLGRVIGDRLVGQIGCTTGADSADDLDAMLGAAGRASAANDDLFVALTGNPPSTGSEFWFHADQINLTAELARVVEEEGPIDVYLAGPSTGKAAFDPVAITEATGRSTMGVSVAGMTPPVLAPWLLEMMGAGGTPTTVVIAITTWQDLFENDKAPCNDAFTDTADDAGRRRAEAFATIPALSGFSGGVRLVGGPAFTYDNELLAASDGAAPGRRGLSDNSDFFDAERAEEQRARYGGRLSPDPGCPRFAASIEALSAELAAQGIEVVLVGMPNHPEMVELVDGGATTFAAVAERYAQIADATGARWVDLTASLSADQFADLTHADQPGRQQITGTLIELLG